MIKINLLNKILQQKVDPDYLENLCREKLSAKGLGTRAYNALLIYTNSTSPPNLKDVINLLQYTTPTTKKIKNFRSKSRKLLEIYLTTILSNSFN